MHGLPVEHFCGNPHFCSIEMQKQHGSGPKVAPADALLLFVCIKVRHQLQLRELLVGDAVQLDQNLLRILEKGQFRILH